MIRKMTGVIVLLILLASICPHVSAFREEIPLDGVAEYSGNQIATAIEETANRQFPDKHIQVTFTENKLIVIGDDAVKDNVFTSIVNGAIRGAVVGAITGGVIGGVGTRSVPGAVAGASEGAQFGAFGGVVAATLDVSGANKWYDEHIGQPIFKRGCSVM